jgi:toxin ParE1/3/4
MSHRLIVLDEAEDELIEAQKWYDRQRSGLGDEFRGAIEEAMERLIKAPLTASPIINLHPTIDARQVLVKRFPYSIIFISLEEDIWVVAFAHQHRRPGYWRERLKP